MECDELTLDVGIPPNVTAEVHIPVSDCSEAACRAVLEGGRPAAASPGVRYQSQHVLPLALHLAFEHHTMHSIWIHHMLLCW